MVAARVDDDGHALGRRAHVDVRVVRADAHEERREALLGLRRGAAREPPPRRRVLPVQRRAVREGGHRRVEDRAGEVERLPVAAGQRPRGPVRRRGPQRVVGAVVEREEQLLRRVAPNLAAYRRRKLGSMAVAGQRALEQQKELQQKVRVRV